VPSQQPHQKGPITQTDEATLQALNLDAEELAALSHNGTIHQEQRGRNTIIFKLRYRLAGRQRVKYLGTDQNLVAQIQTELNDLQAVHQRNHELRRLGKQARALLRETKQRLLAPLAQAGLKFHGRAIRRPRIGV
jgi:hypothetical protein